MYCKLKTLQIEGYALIRLPRVFVTIKDEREARESLKAFFLRPKLKLNFSSERFLPTCSQKMSKGFLKFCKLIPNLIKAYKRA